MLVSHPDMRASERISDVKTIKPEKPETNEIWKLFPIFEIDRAHFFSSSEYFLKKSGFMVFMVFYENM